MRIDEKYIVETTEVPSRPGCWNTLLVEIFQIYENGGKAKIGEYNRSYNMLLRTFHPFVQNGKEYALYSKDYTCTRVMELPSCKDVAGEEPDSYGFCPVDYYVPEIDESIGLRGEFGFIAGCVWGDDSTWKIQYLDLTKLNEGKIKRESRFGFIWLPRGMKLKDAIDVEYYWEEEEDTRVEIACGQWFDAKPFCTESIISEVKKREEKTFTAEELNVLNQEISSLMLNSFCISTALNLLKRNDIEQAKKVLEEGNEKLDEMLKLHKII